MIRALRGDNIEEIMEEVVRSRSTPRFRNISYREFNDAYVNSANGNAVTKILAEPGTFRYFIKQYLDWSSDAELTQRYRHQFNCIFNGAYLVVGEGACWEAGKIYFIDSNNITLSWLDVLDLSPRADLDRAVTVMSSAVQQSFPQRMYPCSVVPRP